MIMGFQPPRPGGCLSYNAVVLGSRVITYPCIKELHHRSDCEDEKGNTWVRLEEDARRRAEAAWGADRGGN